MQLHSTSKRRTKIDIEAENSLDACRRYLAAVVTVCAAASGHPNLAEVVAAVSTLKQMPRMLERLVVAA